MYILHKVKKSNSGLSLLLTILILSGVLVMGLFASDLVLRVGKDSRRIGSSEVAYYAAETAAEDALYHIEIQDSGIAGLDGSGSLEDVGATWSRDVDANVRAPGTSPVTGEINGIWTASVGDITDSNPLMVRLTNGSSFQLDLNIQGASYPAGLSVEWPGAGSQAVVYNQTDQEQSTADTSPASVDSLNSKAYRVRIINNSGAATDYTLRPELDDPRPLPISIIISATGYFLDQERQLELESKRWQIY